MTTPAVDATTPRTSGRRTQEQRAEQTRTRILTATVDCLVDLGYAATTTTMVQRRAGVSRGALMHHFPSKDRLLLDAVTHLAAERGRWLTDTVAALPVERDHVTSAVQLLWGVMTGPLFVAATELWIAARNDAALRESLVAHERVLGQEARRRLAPIFGEDNPDEPDFRRAYDHTLQLLRGAALTSILRDDARWERDLVATAAALYRDLRQPTPRPHTTTEGRTP